MQISPGVPGESYSLAIARRIQDSTAIEGQQALKLIAEATPLAAAPAAPPPGNGRLHIVA